VNNARLSIIIGAAQPTLKWSLFPRLTGTRIRMRVRMRVRMKVRIKMRMREKAEKAGKDFSKRRLGDP